jgi:hypothetical protein
LTPPTSARGRRRRHVAFSADRHVLGRRFCKVADPFGHVWSIATHKEDLTPQEMARRGEEAMRQYAAQQKK